MFFLLTSSHVTQKWLRKCLKVDSNSKGTRAVVCSCSKERAQGHPVVDSLARQRAMRNMNLFCPV